MRRRVHGGIGPELEEIRLVRAFIDAAHGHIRTRQTQTIHDLSSWKSVYSIRKCVDQVHYRLRNYQLIIADSRLIVPSKAFIQFIFH